MKIQKITDEAFKKYGKVLAQYDCAELIREMEHTPLPEDVIYVPSVEELEVLSVARDFQNSMYGGLPIQIGYCNGHNHTLNALEYHRDSEINIAVTDMVLLLAKEEEIEDDHTLDTSEVKAFFVPAGTMIEVYATTLHYAPCQTSAKGFRCVVVLPKGTNGELSHRPENKSGEEKLLAAVNKWLIGHEEGGLPEGSFIGLKGENIEV
mgnify:CR=1 FL=1